MNTKYLLLLLLTVAACSGPAFATTYTNTAQVQGIEDQVTICIGDPCKDRTVWNVGTVTFTVNSSSVSAAYSESSTAESLAAALCSQMTSSFPVQCTGTTEVESDWWNLNLESGTNYPFTSITESSKSGWPSTGSAFTLSMPVITAAQPQYQILSLLYDAPGNKSSNGYTNSTTYGTTSGISSTFQAGTTTTYESTLSFLGFFQSTDGWSYGTASITGDSSQYTFSVSDALGVANQDPGPGYPNAINHQQDLFILWLNPYVVVQQTGANSLGYAVSVPPQGSGDPNPGEPQTQDVVEVTVDELENPSLIPPKVLAPIKLAGGQVLPGLASICKNQTYYPNNCSAAPACGCVASDFTNIVNQDPLLNFTPTQNPTSLNTSTSTRFVLVDEAELLQGPACSGCNVDPNTFTANDSNVAAYSSTSGASVTMGYVSSVSLGLGKLGFSIQETNTQTFTSTMTESAGNVYGETHQAQVILLSSTIDCSENVAVFEDTVFHTFAFQQPAGNNSCP
jgi:hypothetical protein